MSKQVRARAIRRGARFAMERHIRKTEAKRLELPPEPRRRGVPWSVWLLVAVVALLIGLRRAHGAELAPATPTGSDAFSAVALAAVFIAGTLAAYAVTSAIATLAVNAWARRARRKDRS